MRILVVDDEPNILFALREYFGLRGDRIDSARNVVDARRLAAAVSYSLVISDICMGSADNRDGLDLIAELARQNPRPVLFVLTAYGSPELERHAQQLGADAFLHKPVPLRELASIADRALAARADE